MTVLHMAARRLIRATGNILLVQRLLGHSQLQTTARYANLNMDDLRVGMEKAHAKPKLRVVG